MEDQALFDEVNRTDSSPRRFNETTFQFLSRSACSYFGVVRDLINEWLSQVPAEHRYDLTRRLRKDDASHKAAFWELYLHEGYRRSGYTIEIHPELSETPKRPDFCIEGPTGDFYLEAVRVGDNATKIATDRRLDTVHQLLSDLRVQNFTLFLTTDRVGPAPLATKKLRRTLTQWVTGLDADEVSAAIDGVRVVGLRALPQLRWRDDDWDLTFSAGPLVTAGRGVDRPALGAMGSGTAGVVDNVSGLRRVLEKKHGRYGTLKLPLVIAVESDTVIPTRHHEIDRVLYGLSALRPPDDRRQPSDLVEDGFWFGRNGWQHSDTPQIITSRGIQPWSIAAKPADLWSTLEPAACCPPQPSWLRRVVVGPESASEDGADLVAHFGLDRDWVASTPDFHSS